MTAEEGIRRGLSDKFSIVILYNVRGNMIEILPVADSRSNWAWWSDPKQKYPFHCNPISIFHSKHQVRFGLLPYRIWSVVLQFQVLGNIYGGLFMLNFHCNTLRFRNEKGYLSKGLDQKWKLSRANGVILNANRFFVLLDFIFGVGSFIFLHF